MEQFLLGVEELRARTSGKWRMYPSDVLPAFVADMDFKVAPAVQAALTHLTDAHDYGYGQLTDASALFEAFSTWMARRHNWRPDPTLTHANADVVQGLVAAIVAFSEPGDGIIVQTPAYPPFLRYTAATGRRLVENPLVDDGTRFVVDVGGLERIAADEIHGDLVYPGATHIPMETIAAAADRTVTLTSATKGFNIAGVRASVA